MSHDQMKPRAVMVAVNYTDLLRVTLPYNAHHFRDITIITDHASMLDVVKVVAEFDRGTVPVTVLPTDLFYADGARFNKWAALEWGLDRVGRNGLMCLMDADVLWPKNATIPKIERGELWGPVRRMAPWPCRSTAEFRVSVREEAERRGLDTSEQWFAERIPPESRWAVAYELHRNVAEWAGYTQVFWADDKHLPAPPWHQIDWVHAGGADSFFQALWPMTAKRRFDWEVLHLGEAGINWAGRATPLADGTELPGSEDRRDYAGREIWANRRRNRSEGRDQFDGERLKTS